MPIVEMPCLHEMVYVMMLFILMEGEYVDWIILVGVENLSRCTDLMSLELLLVEISHCAQDFQFIMMLEVLVVLGVESC